MINAIKPYVIRTFDKYGHETYRERVNSRNAALAAVDKFVSTRHIVEYDTVSNDCADGDVTSIKPEYQVISDMR